LYVEKGRRLILNAILDSASICNMLFMVIIYLKCPLKLNPLHGSEIMICCYCRSLDSILLADIDEILETAHNTLDDLWKLDDFMYPQQRMEHLMDIIGQ